jgi:hypothetical protein
LAILYGFNQKTPQGKNQQAQTAQEAALESSQEAHLAEVILRCGFNSSVRGRRIFASSANGLLYLRFTHQLNAGT